MPLKIETMGQVCTCSCAALLRGYPRCACTARCCVQIRRKTELEAKVKELEDALVIFNREKVFIADS